MQLQTLITALVAAVVCCPTSAVSTTPLLRTMANDQICYKTCAPGQYCARGSTVCRAPAAGSTECFNPATSRWIAKCDPSFSCQNGRCEVSASAGSPNGALCFKLCPLGHYCARGTSSCRTPKTGSAECFNPATSLWIAKCDPGFTCSQGKCVGAK